MDTQHKVNLFDSNWGYIAVLVLVAGIYVSAFKLTTPYSYWVDELFAVVYSNSSFEDLHRFILQEPNPPFYYLLLKGWISLFGDSEFSTRSLSWLFAVGSIYPLWKFSESYGSIFKICILLFFPSNMLFAYYANEARSYAMALFFAALATTAYPYRYNQKVTYSFLLSCICLSLTHYFGLILAGLILIFCLFQNIRNQTDTLKIICASTIAMLWPVYHVTNGTILNLTGGRFWIKVNGVIDTFEIAASGFVPHSVPFGPYILIGQIIAAISIALYVRYQSIKLGDDVSAIALKGGLMLLCFLTLLATIDLYTPMSWKKYYIVLLPLITIVWASSFSLLCELFPRLQSPVLFLLSVFSLVALLNSYEAVAAKTSYQDWKGTSEFMVENAQGRKLYFVTEHGWSKQFELVANFYIKKASHHRLHATAYVVGETIIEKPALVLFGQETDQNFENLQQEMKKLGGMLAFPKLYDGGGYTPGVYAVD